MEEEEKDTSIVGEKKDQEDIPPETLVVENTKTGYVCVTCNITFARRFNRDRHIRLSHNNIEQVYDCSFCGAIFYNSLQLQRHRESHKPTTGFEEKTSAFRKKCVVFRKTYAEKIITLENALLVDKSDLQELLKFEVNTRRSMKVGLIYHAEFIRLTPQIGGAAVAAATDECEEEQEEAETDCGDDSNLETDDNEGVVTSEMEETDSAETVEMNETRYEVCLRAPSSIVTPSTNVIQFVRNAVQHVQNRIDDFVENGSGWRLNQILCVDVEIGNCAPLNGACDLVSIKYLKSLQSTRVVEDLQQCFLHACAYYFIRQQNPIKLNKFIAEHFVTNIKSPVKVKDIPKFERDNVHLKIKINVIYQEGKSIFPLLFSKKTNAKHHITLLLYKTKVGDKVISHYAYVSDVDKLLRKCYHRGNNYTYSKGKFCLNCFTSFTSRRHGLSSLQEHFKSCTKNKPQAVKIPKEGSVIKFKNHINKFQSYFVGFFDFESCHVKQKYECDKCLKVDEFDSTLCHHQTLVKAIQEPITYSYLILDRKGEIVFKNTYTGENCVIEFLNELIAIEKDLLAVLNHNEPINMSDKDKDNFSVSSHCHICETPLEDDKVMDHCHISGEYLGAAHSLCNLGRIERKTIPMFCHNLTGYDGHFLMQHLGDLKGVTKLSALPYNTEKFRTIEINSYQFKDSLSFLNASLNELMNNLLRDKTHTFEIIDQLQLYKTHEIEKKQLILRKGIYPYEYVTSIEKLQKTHKIPEQKYFFSTLTNSHVSNEDYEHSQKVFQKFGCKDLVDYTELYCSMDVGILAEVVVQFRKLVQLNFNLDCCHYLSTPQMAYDCMLKLTKVEIELLHDVDQILFIEQNIRGGVSYINQRHCVEQKTIDYTTEMKFIDANNLYGFAQSLPMPISDFRWLDDEENENLKIMGMNDKQTEGYILEVDLEYPEKLHESHNSFPLAPEQLQINETMLSPYAKGEKTLVVTFKVDKIENYSFQNATAS